MNEIHALSGSGPPPLLYSSADPHLRPSPYTGAAASSRVCSDARSPTAPGSLRTRGVTGCRPGREDGVLEAAAREVPSVNGSRRRRSSAGGGGLLLPVPVEVGEDSCCLSHRRCRGPMGRGPRSASPAPRARTPGDRIYTHSVQFLVQPYALRVSGRVRGFGPSGGCRPPTCSRGAGGRMVRDRLLWGSLGPPTCPLGAGGRMAQGLAPVGQPAADVLTGGRRPDGA